jgi:Domain of unknown function DUF29
MSTVSPKELYEADFVAWTRLQASELRRLGRMRPNAALDCAHLAEEIADLGKEQRNAMRSWVTRILEHLLLLEHVPAEQPRRGWTDETVDFRDEIEQRLAATLRRDLKRQLPRLYERARGRLVRKLTLRGEADAARRLPERCPYSLDQVLGDFWPATAAGLARP